MPLPLPPAGVSEAFILNSAHHALAALGHPDAGSPGLWGYEPRVNAELQQARQACWSVMGMLPAPSPQPGRLAAPALPPPQRPMPLPLQVEMWVTAQRRIAGVLPGVDIEAGERVLVEISRKFTPQGAWEGVARAAGVGWPCALPPSLPRTQPRRRGGPCVCRGAVPRRCLGEPWHIQLEPAAAAQGGARALLGRYRQPVCRDSRLDGAGAGSAVGLRVQSMGKRCTQTAAGQ